MTIALCPRCSEQVRVLDDASPAAVVRCPLCREEYSLAEALRQLPPLLIMVRDPEIISKSNDFAPTSWDSLDDLTDDLEVAEPVPIALEKASPAVAVSLDKGTATKPKAVAKIRSSARTKPKGSPIKSIISIVLGGLLAFPIAQLILWYLPGDLKRDFGAGPIVAQFLPQIVPAKFRGNKTNTEASGQPSVVDSDSSIPDFRFGGAGTFGVASDVPDDQELLTEVAPQNQSFGVFGGGAPSPSEDQPPMQDREVEAEDDVFASPVGIPGLEIGGLELDPLPEIATPSALDAPIATVESNPATVPTPSTTAPIDDAAPSESARLAVGQVRQPRSISGDELSLRVANAVKVNTSWHEISDGVATSSLKRDFYLAFSKLGEALVFADQDQTQTDEQRSAAAELLNSLGSRRDQREFVGGIASGWIKLGSEKRETDGICLFGVVKSIEKQGEVFVTSLESGGKSLAVVSPTDPSDTVDIDREVLVLGSILHDPANNLGGYVGNHAVVVLHGLHVTVDPE